MLSFVVIALEMRHDATVPTDDATETPSPNAPRTARDRARAELTAEILAAARRQLSEVGAASLSLRAVSRELGMASSALYRYFPSRDALLTQLIIEAYDAMGQAVEDADASCEPEDLLGRWRAMTQSARNWALANPHEYALIYGTPVPGYAAPEVTIGPATRAAQALIGLLVNVDQSGAQPPAITAPVNPLLAAQMDAIYEGPEEVDRQRALIGVLAWVQLFGMINFELFGTFHNVFDDASGLYAHQADFMAAAMGIELDA